MRIPYSALIALILLFSIVLARADDTKCHFPRWSELHDRLEKLTPQSPAADFDRLAKEAAAAPPEECSDARRFRRMAEERVSAWHADKAAPGRGQVRLAFALRRQADGAYAESLDELLGRALEETPKVFLEEAKAYSKTDEWCTDGMVANFGDYGALGENDRKKRLALRRKKLLGVRDPALAAVKAQCLAKVPKL